MRHGPPPPALRTALLLLVIAAAPAGLLPVPFGAPSAGAEEGPSDGLALSVAVEPSTAESGTPVLLTATFRNHGAKPVEVYLPEHLGSVVFPRWSLTFEDGTVYLPHQPSFQSMWGRGLMGSILTLGPGEAKMFTHRVTHVVPRIPDGRRSRANAKPTPVPPGAFTVRATYVQQDDSVPWALPNFRQETRRHPGLWTGTVEGDGVPLTVTPSSKPTIEITAPESGKAGDAFPVRVDLRYAGPEPMRVRGALVLRAGAKAYGSGEVRVLLRDADWRMAGSAAAFEEVTFRPGETRTVELDLASVDLHFRHGHRTSIGGLHELVPTGLFHLSAVLVVEDADQPLASAGLFRRLEPLAEVGPPGLELTLEAVGGSEGTAHRVPGVAVVLRNTGTGPIAVPAHLSYPRHVFFSLTRPGEEANAHAAVSRTASSDPGSLVDVDDPGTRARIHRGLTWDGDRWERPRALTEQSFVLLAPGAEIRRVFDVARLVSDPSALEHGAWTLRAWWRNRLSGRRLGLDPALATGQLASEALTIRGRGW